MSERARTAMTWLVHLSDEDACVRDQFVGRLATAVSRSAAATLVAPTHPGTINGGDIVVHARCAENSAAALRADVGAVLGEMPIDHVDFVKYAVPVVSDDASVGGVTPTIYRVLLVRVDGTPAQIARFERDLLRMPEHVTSMVRWQLSRVIEADGPTAWTHVWEQEFTDLDGLLGQYMAHPIHWGVVDRWFDPEWPEHIVVGRVAHSFCEMDHR